MPIAPKGFRRTLGEYPFIGQVLREFENRVLESPELRHSPIGQVLRAVAPRPSTETPYAPSPAKIGISSEWGPLAESTIKPLLARALNSLPRPIREKLTTSAEKYLVSPTEGRSVYNPSSGISYVTRNEPAEILQTKLAHETKHAADFGIGPYDVDIIYRRYKHAGDVLSNYERGRIADTLEDWGYQPYQAGTETRAIGAESQVGPIYRRGEGRQLMAGKEPERWSVEGIPAVNPLHLSEQGKAALTRQSREEAKIIERARKARARGRAAGMIEYED